MKYFKTELDANWLPQSPISNDILIFIKKYIILIKLKKIIKLI
jgi:hypothetical protein